MKGKYLMTEASRPKLTALTIEKKKSFTVVTNHLSLKF